MASRQKQVVIKFVSCEITQADRSDGLSAVGASVAISIQSTLWKKVTMPKRASTDARPGSQKASRSVSGQVREKPSEDEMGEFEDAWEDEIEDDNDDAAQGGGDGTRVSFYGRCTCTAHGQG